jgi:hypothetical protein
MGVGERLRRGGLLKGALRTLGRLGLLRVAFATYERLLAHTTYSGQTLSSQEHAGGLPIPPPHLRVLVGGSADEDPYLRIGHSMFQGLCTELLSSVVDRPA